MIRFPCESTGTYSSYPHAALSIASRLLIALAVDESVNCNILLSYLLCFINITTRISDFSSSMLAVASGFRPLEL